MEQYAKLNQLISRVEKGCVYLDTENDPDKLIRAQKTFHELLSAIVDETLRLESHYKQRVKFEAMKVIYNDVPTNVLGG